MGHLELVRAAAISLGAGLLYLLATVAVVVLVALVQHWVYLRKQRNAGPRLSSDAPRIKAKMMRMARPTLVLAPAKEPAFSKVGGNPELPPNLAWPDDGGRPRTFVAQIDLAAVRSCGGPEWLPFTGRLYAFVDEMRYGFADLVRVISVDEPFGPAVAPPPRIGGRADRRLAAAFPERRIAFVSYTSLPSLDWLGIDLSELDLSEEELDALAEAPDAPFGDELQHRIGGYPSEIQDEQMAISCELMRRGLPPEYEGTEITPPIERASKQWRLLLQVDSDPALKMNWGDGGRLYVFIREKDALAGDFSRTVTISQTY
ncbi:MAG: DUF1963 domain-containing protein [Phenylobacterium sp.]|uniref:YwqG family protein n=1 Tax=Phenylobacterium sp. TaxID=1871053 RepID=UPI0012016AEB|nr:YwqG family protein [Phenylobacterium sp.]TAJ70908.1 MAG: DUF1963 domain-containing protein [Phenylobacterium sp.]